MAPRKKKPAPARKAAKPPVINLKATEVKSATEKAEEQAREKAKVQKARNVQQSESKKPESGKPAEKAKRNDAAKPASAGKKTNKKNNKKTGLVVVGVAALVAAGLAGAWAFKTYGSSYFADPNLVRAEQFSQVAVRVAKLEAAVAENKNNTDLVASLKKQIDASSAKLAVNAAATKANAEKLAKLESTASEIRVALAKAVENGRGPVAVANELQFKALSEKLSGLEKNLATLKETPVADSSAELESLKTRFDAFLVRLSATEEATGAVAKSVDLVKAAQDKLANARPGNPASELAKAFTILRAKISSGQAFAVELDNVAGQMPDEETLDVLRPFASTGVPTLATLSEALNDVKISTAAPVTEQTENNTKGVFGTLTNRLSGLVKVTKAGEADWSELKQKALQALAAGQVESAKNILAEGADAADAPVEITAWLSLADKKVKVDQAIKGLSAKIVARLTAGNE